MRTKILIAFLLVIGASFYLVAASTIRRVGDSLFEDTVRAQLTHVSQLATTLGERDLPADPFYQQLLEAARQSGGRLLVVDENGKVTFDTFDERCGTLLALSEVYSVLGGEKDADYGFHQQDGEGRRQAASVLDRLSGRDLDRVWVGSFCAAI